MKTSVLILFIKIEFIPIQFTQATSVKKPTEKRSFLRVGYKEVNTVNRELVRKLQYILQKHW